jgi:hypothetical protein
VPREFLPDRHPQVARGGFVNGLTLRSERLGDVDDALRGGELLLQAVIAGAHPLPDVAAEKCREQREQDADGAEVRSDNPPELLAPCRDRRPLGRPEKAEPQQGRAPA